MSRTIKLAAAAFFAAVTLTPAAMAQRPEQRSVSVFYGDLNLNSTGGEETLLKRIRFASQKICGRSPGGTMLINVEIFRTCKNGVMVQTISSIGSASRSARFASLVGAPETMMAQR